MRRYKPSNYYDLSESLIRLVEIMRKDTWINREVTRMLKLDAYRRRIVLNDWLEGLRRKNAPVDLLRAFSCLFDDDIARQVLLIINKHNI